MIQPWEPMVESSKHLPPSLAGRKPQSAEVLMAKNRAEVVRCILLMVMGSDYLVDRASSPVLLQKLFFQCYSCWTKIL
jgi:hypothetical protein